MNSFFERLQELTNKIVKPRWIVDEEGDVGIKVCNLTFTNYKWADTFIIRRASAHKWREAKKRELNGFDF